MMTRTAARGWMYAAPAAATIFVVLAALVHSHQDTLVTLDSSVSTAAHRFTIHHYGWWAVAGLFTHFGDTVVVLTALTLMTGLLLARRKWRPALFIVAALATSILLSHGVRALVQRHRPVDQLWPASGYAFPSSHAANAATAALIVAFLCWPLLGRSGRVGLLAVTVGVAAVVGITRVMLVVHWPSDVLGGWLVGLIAVPPVAVLLHLVARPARVPTAVSAPT